MLTAQFKELIKSQGPSRCRNHPMGVPQNALARAISVPPRRINEIVHGLRGVTVDTDLRLARFFGLSEGFFMALQTEHDLMRRRREIGAELKAIRPRAA